jgi:predicted metal-dependent phosphotriesterase family hydrolase
LTTPFPPDGLATAAKALRASGFTERELDILFKENPARILGLAVTAPR